MPNIYPKNPVINEVLTAFEAAVVDERVKSRMPMTSLLFPESTVRTLNNDQVQIDKKTGEITAAPLGVPGSAAKSIKLRGGDSRVIALPESFMKHMLSDDPVFSQRMLGQFQSFTNDSQAMRVLADQLAEGARTFIEKKELLIEAMVCMLLTGKIEYSVEGGDSFTLSLDRDTDLDYVPTTLWDQASSDILHDLKTLNDISFDLGGQPLTDGYCSPEAVEAINKSISAGRVKFDNTMDIAVGNYMGHVTNYNEKGIRFLGSIGTKRFWEVRNNVKLDDGTVIPAVPAKKIHFVSMTPSAMAARRLYFAHMLTKRDQNMIGWVQGTQATWIDVQSDPVALVSYFKTRPLPWTLGRNDTATMLVAT